MARIGVKWLRRGSMLGLATLLVGSLSGGDAPGRVEAQAPIIVSGGVSNGYALPRSKQGISDAYFYQPGNPPYDTRMDVFNSWGIGINIHTVHWYEGPNGTDGTDISSHTTLPSCPGGQVAFPQNATQKATLGIYKYHCINKSWQDTFDLTLNKEATLGMQTAVVLWGAPTRLRNPACTRGLSCAPNGTAGLEEWQDWVGYLAWRYNGVPGAFGSGKEGVTGKIRHYIVWNEVEEAEWFDMSGMVTNANNPTAGDVAIWTNHYAWMMIRAHNTIVQSTSGVMLYAALANQWTKNPSRPTHIGGQTVIDALWGLLGTWCDWSIAFHPYMDPINDGDPFNINFWELNGTVIQYQRNRLTALGVPNHAAKPQAYVFASEQGWPTQPVGWFPAVSKEDQARNICLTHDIVMGNQFIVGTTHFHIQNRAGLSPLDLLFGLVPDTAGITLDGDRASTTLKAYESTALSHWGQSDLHYCCLAYDKGCRNARSASYAAPMSGKSELADFTGDNYADYAEQATTGVDPSFFYVHSNNQAGNFSGPGNDWAYGTANRGSDWEILVADFTGDGAADYAELHKPTGQFWVHRNTVWGSPRFESANWATGVAYAGGPYVEFFAGQFNNDGYADIASRNVRTGYMAIRRNKGSGGGSNWFVDLHLNAGPTSVGPNWRTYVADLSGDGRTDFIDLWVPGGNMWRHVNDGNATNFFSTTGDPISGTVAPGYAPFFGDFNGDNIADLADLYNPGTGVGYFFMHLNSGGTSFGGNYGASPISTGGAPNWRILNAQP